MVEDLIKLMVERWYLPETQVRMFLSGALPAENNSLNLEQLRELTASLLQDTILGSVEENKNPTLAE